MLELQHSDNPELVIWTVWDRDGPEGSYPSPERAINYIYEWMNTEGTSDPVEVLTANAHQWSVKCSNCVFNINKSHYRL